MSAPRAIRDVRITIYPSIDDVVPDLTFPLVSIYFTGGDVVLCTFAEKSCSLFCGMYCCSV